jgi:hypothetical protein
MYLGVSTAVILRRNGPAEGRRNTSLSRLKLIQHNRYWRLAYIVEWRYLGACARVCVWMHLS